MAACMYSTALCWTRCLRVRRALKRMCFRECSNRACTLSSSTACSLISARPKITLEPRRSARAFIRQLRLIRDWSEHLSKRCGALSRAVFLDRDGVINQRPPEGDYITLWEDFHILPGVA